MCSAKPESMDKSCIDCKMIVRWLYDVEVEVQQEYIVQFSTIEYN